MLFLGICAYLTLGLLTLLIARLADREGGWWGANLAAVFAWPLFWLVVFVDLVGYALVPLVFLTCVVVGIIFWIRS